MIRIRLHGRGGQGIKTASQILGTAAFLGGFEVQDFPLYGAERRGAPIAAFARIDRQPVRERGPILRPDLVLIGDETLLEDGAPLAGTGPDTVIFINSTRAAEELKAHYRLPGTPFCADLTGLCLQTIQKRSILSSALAAAGARLTGAIPLRHLIRALRIELADGGLPARKIRDNMILARTVFRAFTPAPLPEASVPAPRAAVPATLARQRPVDAAPIIFNAGNMVLRQTGNWRVERPEIDYAVCNACGICFARCPDGDIRLGEDGKPVIDYDHCKGCLICAAECPKHAIQGVREVSSWK